MKIAVCISGDMRNYLQTYSNQLENIFSQIDCDIYISTWEDDTTNWNQVISTYQPRALKIENKRSMNLTVRNNKTVATGMFYKIFNCFHMLKESSQAYDAVIRMRPDSFFNSKIKISELGNYIYVSGIEKKVRWIEDTFAYGNFHNMEVYSSLFLELGYLSALLEGFHPETLLKHHLEIQSVPIKQCSIVSGTLRENGEINSHCGYSGSPEGFFSFRL